MSRETMEWLNTNTLIGFTDKRGNAWHYRAESQGDEPNHYTGAVPFGDVVRRLFSWDVVELPLHVNAPVSDFGSDWTGIGEDGMPYRTVTVPDRKALLRSDTGTVLGIHSDGYTVHPYRAWLLENVSTILGDSLAIGSAGLLKGGAVAWVQVEVPDTITTPEGVAFRPHLTAATSHDGSLATTYSRNVQVVVCDNTLSAAQGETGQKFRVKHTRNSALRIRDAREALAMVETTADAFAESVRELCSVTVTDRQWFAFLDAMVPMPDARGRSRTMAENKRDTLTRLYRRDARCAPWTGTAFGVVQTVNTFTHHEGIVRGESRADRNMLRAVSGGVDTLDRTTLDTLNKVLSNA